MGVESAFGQVSATLQRMFGLKLSSDALERINAQLAQRVQNYRYDRPKPVAATEGEVVVASADGKGIVTPRLWQAAHVFHPEGSEAAEAFVRERCLRVLQGRVAGVIRGLPEMATKHGLSGSKKKTIRQVCAYLEKNRTRMRYDEYLAAGDPIASGGIEGACRHLVKDRMERAGMHWTPWGAQAMLEVGSVHVDGAWEGYQPYRIEREMRELYPYRYLVEGTHYALAC